MGGVKAVTGVGRKPKVKPTGDTDFENVFNIDVPEYMNTMDQAVVMWNSIVPELLKRKVLKLTDLHNIEMFCMAYHNLREAQNEVVLYGVSIQTDSGRIKNPALTAVNEASKQMASFGAMLGLDPASRNRLTGTGGKPKENAFAKVLNM
ncbi:phage terminase small subunit P27 family [Acinetobacter chinensis]|uniref:Phage terminase small subunit P27 family n=1 Tax=Acinetobacter chinensis TaxID=2004650 RepID=A0A3B7LUV8_9GAMM|nr:phage terminase small subunit P27 family [Acinetobacter chinensis]AXY56632.1 phage terminase small subunit P27 family [Acinetobacter chinensis]